MSKIVVAIIGRPNVGKSTFFNMLIGEDLSITADISGVTRDRVIADTAWRGKTFQLIDTGGIEPYSEDEILKSMRRQAEFAIDMADVILFLTDIKSGVTQADLEISQMLRRTKKPVILVCNKVDNVGAAPLDMYEMYNLGLGEPYPVSSIAKLGIGEVLDAIYDSVASNMSDEEDENRISVALIGKPNVGKSSLSNKMLNEERSIVSGVAGTTRDAIDTPFENKFGKYVIIDTAGIRKKNKVTDEIERYSIIRAKSAVERAQVALIVIDATEGVTDQDEKIAGIAHEKGKAIIIVVNKWDLIEKDGMTLNEYTKKIREHFKFMSYAPIITISAMTGQRVDKLFELINKVYEANNFRVPTGVLNDLVIEAMAVHPAPTNKGRRLKIYYATEVTVAPPTFVLFVNNKELAHFSYIRYLENEIRKRFDLEGTPINILVREKAKNEDKDKDKYK